MNYKSTTALLGAALAVSIGIMGLNGVFSMPSGIVTTTSDNNGGENLLGHVTVYVTGNDGQIKAYRQMDNVVTNVGRTCTAGALFGAGGNTACTPAAFQYIAIGTGTAAEVTTNTALVTESLRNVRTTYSITNSTGATGGIATQSATFGFSSSTAVAESGIFDAASGTGHMFARKTISPVVNVQSGDTLTVTWSVTTG